MSTHLEPGERAAGTSVSPATDGVPARFSDVQAEWAAVRQRCGVLDAGFRTVLRAAGSDRLSFLQGMLSNDVAGLQPGQGTYAALLTVQGKVVSDLRVYVLADEVWLDVPAWRATAVRESLEKYIIADDVELESSDATAALVAVEGPRAAATVAAMTGTAVEGLAPHAHRELSFAGARLRVAAVTHTGEPGYLFLGDRAARADLWERGRAAGAQPVGMDALDVLRIEAGIPWYGRDIDEDTLISEAGLESAISYRKGCYLGQEVVERVAARGQVHRKLLGLVCAGFVVPPAGATLRYDDKEVGAITSAAWSPARDAVIALAYVRRECWTPGSELRVTLPAGDVAARVATLPFLT